MGLEHLDGEVDGRSGHLVDENPRQGDALGRDRKLERVGAAAGDGEGPMRFGKRRFHVGFLVSGFPVNTNSTALPRRKRGYTLVSQVRLPEASTVNVKRAVEPSGA